MSFVDLETLFLSLISSKSNGTASRLVKISLIIPSYLWNLVTKCRNWIYDKGFFCRYIAPVPLTISIGNIVVGGTGKTPLTIFLARLFSAHCLSAVLARGYKGAAEKLEQPITLSLGKGPLHTPAMCGDEPYLISQRVPHAFVVVGKDRIAGAEMAVALGAQVLLLDDGFQHRRMGRDIDIVLLNANDLFGQGYLLPRGLLRESPESLNRAQLIIINSSPHDEKQFATLAEQIKLYSKAPIVGMAPKIDAYLNLKGQYATPLPRGTKVALFCGIAAPERFEQSLAEEGLDIVSKLEIKDHGIFNLHNLNQFVNNARNSGAEWIICTEKDAVKLPEKLSLSLPLIIPRMELAVLHGEPEWKQFLETTLARITQP